MILRFLATAFATLGVGKIPKAPGTFGSLLALPVWWALCSFSLSWQILFILTAFLLGWLATYYYEKINHKHDPKEVVVDELIGMWVTLLGASPKVSIFIFGFLLFRFFDIRKPLLIGWVDKNVPGAFGTILDDIVAGVFAYVCLQFCLRYGSSLAIFNT